MQCHTDYKFVYLFFYFVFFWNNFLICFRDYVLSNGTVWQAFTGVACSGKITELRAESETVEHLFLNIVSNSNSTYV